MSKERFFPDSVKKNVSFFTLLTSFSIIIMIIIEYKGGAPCSPNRTSAAHHC